ncbi:MULTISPECIES: carboxymuconolactone decarboxylase family protein [Methanospirillum]|jgi:4-carboxymuconolactone decarboxylase|uniref:Carboxymuconolactone decarboxylase family protein n=1 Tax=Methanospirillum lacunae TaxID=668570 RepID=A0A2V2MXK5_9EURY|nr:MULTISPECIES: carboxymuconolactone decarboxylase family protein [Methanospirillum]PWR70126.1 carboxymuconolactone decarboxylase family protein [Methanospirillum lacunae]HWQ64097.1 carboxymuconolactone decarboxylase family protein [Methanospirillum sp.]
MTAGIDDLETKIGKVPRVFKKLAETDPDLHEMILKLDQYIWDDGALSRKTKKLIAIAIATSMRDQHAIRAQMAGAKNLGVTKDEVEEALRVAYLLAGMPAYVNGKIVEEEVM